MKTEVLRSTGELAAISEEWNELLRDSAADTIFLTWEWVSSWIEVQARPPEIFVLVCRDQEGRMVGLAPFYLATHRLGGLKKVSVLRVLGDTSAGAEYGNIIIRNGVSDDALASVADGLEAASKEWHLIWIPNLAKWSDSYALLLRIFARGRYPVRERPRSFSSTPLPPDPEEFLKRASANRRQQIRRTCRKVFADQDLQVFEVRSPDRLEYYLETLFELHRQRWALRDEPGAFEREPMLKSFYHSFSPKALKRDWLSVFVLERAGEPVAIQYGFRYDNSFLQLQEGWIASDKSGIGTALRMRSIERLIDQGIGEYDFLGGHTEHKRRWQAEEREGCDLLAANRRPLSALIFRSGIWPTGRYLKQVG